MLIFLNEYIYAKTEILMIKKIPQSDSTKGFLPISSDGKFSQIQGLQDPSI